MCLSFQIALWIRWNERNSTWFRFQVLHLRFSVSSWQVTRHRLLLKARFVHLNLVCNLAGLNSEKSCRITRTFAFCIILYPYCACYSMKLDTNMFLTESTSLSGHMWRCGAATKMVQKTQLGAARGEIYQGDRWMWWLAKLQSCMNKVSLEKLKLWRHFAGRCWIVLAAPLTKFVNSDTNSIDDGFHVVRCKTWSSRRDKMDNGMNNTFHIGNVLKFNHWHSHHKRNPWIGCGCWQPERRLGGHGVHI